MRTSRGTFGGEPARGDRAAAAARRLAQLAADLGASDPGLGDFTRVVPARRAVPPEPDPVPVAEVTAAVGPSVMPRPGRHAARRLRGLRRPPLPGLSPAHVAVLAVVVALGVGLAAWWVVRDRSTPVEPAGVSAVEPVEPLVPAGGGGATPSATGTAGTVTVDVTGKVRRPGIVVLDTGARVVDALEAAGGERAGVDLGSLNLARVLVDGEQIVVGAPAAAVPAAPTGAVPSGAPTTLVNLNTATQSELETLPDVGPVTAAAILAWRDEHGGFTSVDELLEVSGIGEATLSTVAPYVTV